MSISPREHEEKPKRRPRSSGKKRLPMIAAAGALAAWMAGVEKTAQAQAEKPPLATTTEQTNAQEEWDWEKQQEEAKHLYLRDFDKAAEIFSKAILKVRNNNNRPPVSIDKYFE